MTLGWCAEECEKHELCVSFQWKQSESMATTTLPSICELSASCIEDLANAGGDFMLFLKLRNNFFF